MEITMPARITLESLAGMVKQGFDQMGQRFDAVEGSLSDIEIRMDQTAYRFELKELEGRVTALENFCRS